MFESQQNCASCYQIVGAKYDNLQLISIEICQLRLYVITCINIFKKLETLNLNKLFFFCCLTNILLLGASEMDYTNQVSAIQRPIIVGVSRQKGFPFLIRLNPKILNQAANL